MSNGVWFSVSDNWYIDICQIREIGAPSDDNNKCIEVTFNDGKEMRYSVEDAQKILKQFYEVVNYKSFIMPKEPYINSIDLKTKIISSGLREDK